jgi:chromosome segregation ATPase
MESNGRCTNCEQLTQIKILSRQVLKKYDELLEKYKENENQYNDVVKRLKEREAMLEDMKKLIEPAMSEHERLMIKYDIELDCRTEAENVARKMTAQNVSLKRQSQALLSHLGKIDITQIPEEILEESSEEDTASYKEYTDTLNATIKDLEEKICYYSTALGETKQELSVEHEDNIRLQQRNENMKQNLHQIQNTLTQYQNAMGELSSMSESAYEEYEHLKNKYEFEVKQRDVAQKDMLKIKAQTQAMKTQSTILLSKVANDQLLTNALFKVEELEEAKVNLEKKFEDFEKEMEDIANEDKIGALEEEKSNLSGEVTDLTKKLTNYEQLYATLECKYKELEEKLENALKPAPPPPPPLPPPPPTTQSKGFLGKIRRKKKGAAPNQASGVNQEGYNKAMDEMMKRINSGKLELRKTNNNRPSVRKHPEQSGAMQELHSVLNRFKKTQSESSVQSSSGSIETIDPESDLAKTFNKVKGKAIQKSATMPAKLSSVQENEDPSRQDNSGSVLNK